MPGPTIPVPNRNPANPAWSPPWWVDPLIDAGMAVAGGAYSNYQNKKNSERAYEQQKEFAQHGIRWRVEDAKAAGLHPLYALGAQPLQFSPTFATDSLGPALASAGQSVGRAISAQQTATQRMADQLALELARSQIKETDARAVLARAEALRALRDAGPGFPEVNMPEEKLIDATASTAGGAKLVPAQITMSRPDNAGVVAGPANPAMREYQLPSGLPVMLPDASNVGEAIEPLSESWALGYGVYQENVKRYGPEWRRQFLRTYAPEWVQFLFGLKQKQRFEHYDERAIKRDARREHKRWIDEMR